MLTCGLLRSYAMPRASCCGTGRANLKLELRVTRSHHRRTRRAARLRQLRDETRVWACGAARVRCGARAAACACGDKGGRRTRGAFIMRPRASMVRSIVNRGRGCGHKRLSVDATSCGRRMSGRADGEFLELLLWCLSRAARACVLTTAFLGKSSCQYIKSDSG